MAPSCGCKSGLRSIEKTTWRGNCGGESSSASRSRASRCATRTRLNCRAPKRHPRCNRLPKYFLKRFASDLTQGGSDGRSDARAGESDAALVRDAARAPHARGPRLVLLEV